MLVQSPLCVLNFRMYIYNLWMEPVMVDGGVGMIRGGVG